jgi:hypothetical protein
VAVKLGHFAPCKHQALALAPVPLVEDMILNDFELIEEAVMQAIQRVRIVGDGVEGWAAR